MEVVHILLPLLEERDERIHGLFRGLEVVRVLLLECARRLDRQLVELLEVVGADLLVRGNLLNGLTKNFFVASFVVFLLCCFSFC